METGDLLTHLNLASMRIFQPDASMSTQCTVYQVIFPSELHLPISLLQILRLSGGPVTTSTNSRQEDTLRCLLKTHGQGKV